MSITRAESFVGVTPGTLVCWLSFRWPGANFNVEVLALQSVPASRKNRGRPSSSGLKSCSHDRSYQTATCEEEQRRFRNACNVVEQIVTITRRWEILERAIGWI